MLFKNLIIFTSCLVGLAAATAVPSNPGVILRKDAPAGVEIHEFKAEDLTAINEALKTSPVVPSGLLKRSDCAGSGYCASTNAANCVRAIQGYGDQTLYCGYTSRVSGGCTAIYTCQNYNGHCMYGWWIKQQLQKVYTEVGCDICGSYTIPNGSVIGCRATLNYCSNCNNIG